MSPQDTTREPPSGRTGASGVPTEDRAFRWEAAAWLASRYAQASRDLRDAQWSSFRDFADLWSEQLDWDRDGGLDEYLGLPADARRDRAERFRRQAQSWDVTLRFPQDDAASESARRAEWRARFARQRRRAESRAASSEARWERVRRLLDEEAERRGVPDALRDAWETLGLPARATLPQARRRYRELARELHPDARGSDAEMKALNDAWRRVAAWFVGS